MKKSFVLDTNVILHDSSCIYHFKENDVVVPISVLEELDQFKKGNETINFHAREFVRTLDSLSGDKLFNGGVKIGPDSGKIILKLEQGFHEDLVDNFASHKHDHRLLNIAYHLSKDKPDTQIILLTKDVNLRMKAKAVGLLAQDYTSDHVRDINTLYAGKRIEEEISSDIIDKMYQQTNEVEINEIDLQQPMIANEYIVMRNGRKSALAKFDSVMQRLQRIDKYPAYGIVPRNVEQTFAINALTDPSIHLVSITGKAGTGKTLIALAAALEKRQNYRQIFMARPIVPLSNKDMGFLPGDISAKLDPYMQPLHDNLAVIQNQFSEHDSRHQKIKEMLDDEKLVISPLSYIRGRSLVKIFFIVDEAQNLTPHEVKTIITRAGEGTKVVFTGDIFQIDHPYLDSLSNGLSHLIEKMQGQKLYAHITLEKGERSELADLASDLL
ncbi:MAG: PhoH family protein [Desulfobacteraceae bacterium]|nr:PhoH family protein [Desulfobacteraceae bacterium]MBC2754571.1 PhoH family protein [Desulfobacteraceae bacterium]